MSRMSRVISVGAKFVEFDLETEGAEDKGGYAKAQSEDFLKRQQEQMAAVSAAASAKALSLSRPGRAAGAGGNTFQPGAEDVEDDDDAVLFHHPFLDQKT